MNNFRSIGLLLIISQALVEFISASEHSTQCLPLLGDLPACEGFPRNAYQCCDAIRALANQQCDCNPFIRGLLGEEGSCVFQLEPVCRVLQPIRWFSVPISFRRDCSEVETFAYGCEQHDSQIDAARYSKLAILTSLLDNNRDETMCFDTPEFLDGLGQVFRDGGSLYVPYGAGNYTGAQDIAEYLGIPFNGLTHGWWQYNLTRNEDSGANARFDISKDGNTWIVGSTSSGGSFLRGALPYKPYYTEQNIIFFGCEEKIAQNNIVATKDIMTEILTRFGQTVDYSKRYGIEDVCRYHTAFCAGDPVTSQYVDEQECLDYIRALPLYTEQCGKNRMFAGLSRACKWKHHWMIPTNPKLHCPHIGKAGAIDSMGGTKCDDVSECSDDEGQDSWPPLTEVGPDTPDGQIKVFRENNVGFEDEPLGCAIPVA